MDDITATRWIDGAACRGRLELFYAPHAERPPARARREAEGRRVCAACPVREPCLRHARSHGEMGLWGGETEEERSDAGYPPRTDPVLVVRRPLAS
ncbi:MAG TPA: WhiB family transcriptional regulator [Iamia sp.]|nr:WhiB family transcriptional regulator [Iamia sp.]